MKFYKENRINPAASCLPILVQIPIFISLFFLLKSFTDNVDYVQGDNLEWLGLINILDKASVGWGPLLIVIYITSQLASTYFMSATWNGRSGCSCSRCRSSSSRSSSTSRPASSSTGRRRTSGPSGQGIVTRQLVPRTKVTRPEEELAHASQGRGGTG